MKYIIPVCAALLFATGCTESRSEPTVISHGMKWSIAQRDLEQNDWVIAVAKPTASIAVNSGKAYRYANPQGDIVDVITEQVGDTEKIYRIFDGNGREIDNLAYRKPGPP